MGDLFAERRAIFKGMIDKAVSESPLDPKLEELEIQIPTTSAPEGWTSRTKIVRPKADADVGTSKRPLIVLFFGGGFMVGEPEMMLAPARAFALKYGAVVACPSYRLCPDVVWPVPQKDAFDTLIWLSQNAPKEFGANLDDGFIVGGPSAGATISGAAISQSMFPDVEGNIGDKLARPFTGAWLGTVWYFVSETVPEEYKDLWTSRQDSFDAEGFNTTQLAFVLDLLKCQDYTSPWISPAPGLAKGEPKNKFKIHLEYCGLDPLRDDAVVFQKLCEKRGVPVKSRFYADDVHNGWSFGTPPAKATNPTMEEGGMEAMKWLLGV